MSNFDQSRYWVDRHENLQGDPRSVGNMAVSVAQNLEGEAEFKRAVGGLAARLVQPGARVLDLGCGYGRVAGAFIDAGFDYTGLDVSDVAIAQAVQNEPRGQFRQADLLTWDPADTYDLVSVLFVLVHFVDDADWARFLATALRSVKPGGRLLIADYFPADARSSAQHFVARPWSDYVARLADAGFTAETAPVAAARAADPDNSHFKYMRLMARD